MKKERIHCRIPEVHGHSAFSKSQTFSYKNIFFMPSQGSVFVPRTFLTQVLHERCHYVVSNTTFLHFHIAYSDHYLLIFSCIVYLQKPLHVFVYLKKIVYNCVLFLKNKKLGSLNFNLLIINSNLNQNFQVFWRHTVSSICASYVTLRK